MRHLSVSPVPNTGKTVQLPQSNSTPEVTNSSANLIMHKNFNLVFGFNNENKMWIPNLEKLQQNLVLQWPNQPKRSESKIFFLSLWSTLYSFLWSQDSGNQTLDFWANSNEGNRH